MTKRNIIIFLLIFNIFMTNESFTWFTSKVSNDDNYIRIGKIPHKKVKSKLFLDAYIYQYDEKSQIDIPNYSEWLNTLSINCIEQAIGSAFPNKKIKLSQIKPHNKKINYVGIFTPHDLGIKRFNKFLISLEILRDGLVIGKDYTSLKNQCKFFKFDMDTGDFLPVITDSIVDIVVIDLKPLLEEHLDAKFIKITYHSDIGDFSKIIRQ